MRLTTQLNEYKAAKKALLGATTSPAFDEIKDVIRSLDRIFDSQNPKKSTALLVLLKKIVDEKGKHNRNQFSRDLINEAQPNTFFTSGNIHLKTALQKLCSNLKGDNHHGCIQKNVTMQN